MELSIHINPKTSASYQKQISDQLIELIITHRIRAGECLPSSRTLSQQITVSRNTVNGAYDKLIKQGYIESIPGSGTYVCNILPNNAIKIKGIINEENIIKKKHPVELKTYINGILITQFLIFRLKEQTLILFRPKYGEELFTTLRNKGSPHE